MDTESNLITDSKLDNPAPETESFIGEGSTSVCYKVKFDGKTYCMKRLRPELSEYQRYREVMRKEYELGSQLNCPYIVHYADFGEDKKGCYLLTDYVKGPSLTTFVKEHPDYFKHRAARRMFIDELLTAVDYLHQRQILHLDLKPDNILITEIGNHVKLVDCGFAYQDCFTQTTGGTQGYSAPEQFDHKYPLSTACDIYAIGNILKKLHLSPKRVTDKCLRENPKERYRSVNELRKALESHTALYVALTFCLIVIVGGFFLFPGHHATKIPARYSKYLLKVDSSGKFKVRTIVFDSVSQPPLVGGLIDPCDSQNLALKGIILSTDTDDLFLTDTLVSSQQLEFGSISFNNDIKTDATVIINCTRLGAEEYAFPLQNLMGDRDYYVKAFITTQQRECVYGEMAKIHTHPFNRYNGSADVANVFHTDKYTAFDLMTDEIIDIKKDGCFFSSNEHATQCLPNTAYTHTDFYKFKTRWNYRLWYTHCGGEIWNSIYKIKVYRPIMHFKDGKLTISNNPENAGDALTFYYTINGNWLRPENFRQRYTGPIPIKRPCQVHCYATTSDGNISFTTSYAVLPEQLK